MVGRDEAPAEALDELLLSGLELVTKLAVLVPPLRVRRTRFHGVFAPNATPRSPCRP